MSALNTSSFSFYFIFSHLLFVLFFLFLFSSSSYFLRVIPSPFPSFLFSSHAQSYFFPITSFHSHLFSFPFRTLLPTYLFTVTSSSLSTFFSSHPQSPFFLRPPVLPSSPRLSFTCPSLRLI